jgi:hypothetical protein
MAQPDLVAPSAQAEGHVSEGAQKLARRIYDPVGDPSGKQGVRRLRKVAAATKSLQKRRGARYVHLKAARKRFSPRAHRFKIG